MTVQQDTKTTGPLAGVTVVDISTVVMGRTRPRSSATSAPMSSASSLRSTPPGPRPPTPAATGYGAALHAG